ncbi:MAG: ferritin-like domain-containing protein [Candidatus Margulisiibacteriota bacterium]|jgi:rubrerythrin
MGIKEELVQMLNKALELEHAARIQYLAHAETIKGETSEKIIERLKEIAGDEEKHEGKFRNLIGNYLNGEPVMSLAPTHRAEGNKAIFEVNLKGEKEAIDFYKQIYQKVTDNKKDLQYEYETLEHEIRHVIVDEQEHVAELSQLLGK